MKGSGREMKNKKGKEKATAQAQAQAQTQAKEQGPITDFYNKNKKVTQVGKESELNLKHKQPLFNEVRNKQEAEQKLVEFDLNANYGPCKGITRSKRYELALLFKLNPPEEIKRLVEEFNLEKSYYDRFV